jgi:hypothetical protein
MYGATWNAARQPTDDEFYCVMLTDDHLVTPGKIAPGKGSFNEMVTKAHGILRDEPGVAQVHVNHKGNFWERVTR